MQESSILVKSYEKTNAISVLSCKSEANLYGNMGNKCSLAPISTSYLI